MKALLALLGASNESEAIEAVHSLNSFLSDTRAATGAQDTSSALKTIQESAAASRQLEAITGKKGHDAINQVTAWKESAGTADKLAKQVADLEKTSQETERDACIAQLSADGKLPPSLHGWAKTKATKEELLADVEAWGQTQTIAGGDGKPVQTNPTTGSKPGEKPAGSSDGATLNADELEVCKQLGIEPSQFLERKKFEATSNDRQAVNTLAGGKA